MKRRAIAHINTNERRGGAATVARRLMLLQNQNGHSSKIVAGEVYDADKYTIPFPTEAPIELSQECRKKGLQYFELQGSHKLLREPYVESADILHFHNLHRGYFNPFSVPLLANKTPTVWTLHDMHSFTGHCAHSMECKRYVTGCHSCPHLDFHFELEVDSAHYLYSQKKFIYDRSPLSIVVPSDWLKRRVECSILSDHPVELIYNSICTDTFKPYDKKECRKEFGLPEDGILIGAAADFGIIDNPWKGGDWLKSALEDLWNLYPNMRFVNIGAAAPDQNDQFISIGYIDDEDKLARAMSALDLFLYSSKAENCPLVILEAMGVGLPIVSFATGGIPELIEHGKSGMVAKYGNTEELVSLTREVLDYENRRSLMGIHARELAVKKYNHSVMYEAYEKAYERAIEHFNSSEKVWPPFKPEELPKQIQTRTMLAVLDESLEEKWQKEKDEINELYYQNEWMKCIDRLHTLMDQDMSDHEVLTLLGECYYKIGEYKHAESALILSINLNERNVHSMRLLDETRAALERENVSQG